MDERNDGGVMQLNKAEIFALHVAQMDVQAAEKRVVEAREHFRVMAAAIGLDPDVDYAIAPDGTATPAGSAAEPDPTPINRATRRRAAKA